MSDIGQFQVMFLEFCWIIHTDKNKLSSFRTEQGYPVIARCANLPTEIHNGNGLGGGRVIGWLPIVSGKFFFSQPVNLFVG